MSQRNRGNAKLNKIAYILENLENAKAEEINIEDLSAKDAIVVVMGPTGTGKSTFIEIATGVGGRAGHALESYTSQISVVKVSFPGVVDSDICFVDTPGFDDTKTSDSGTLKMISDWLNATYKRHIQLTGLLYFHRISDNRMNGNPLKNLRVFEKLCGEDFKGIVLTTTMWNDVDEDEGERRENELRTEFWKCMINRGSSVKRFYGNRKSAFDILAPIFDEANHRSALLLQKEMNDLGLQLKQTAAGRTLHSELGELVKRYQECMERLRSELREQTLDPKQLEVLTKGYETVSKQLQHATEDLKKMKLSVGDRIQRGIKRLEWSRIFSIFSFRKNPLDRTLDQTAIVQVSWIAEQENDLTQEKDELLEQEELSQEALSQEDLSQEALVQEDLAQDELAQLEQEELVQQQELARQQLAQRQELDRQQLAQRQALARERQRVKQQVPSYRQMG